MQSFGVGQCGGEIEQQRGILFRVKGRVESHRGGVTGGVVDWSLVVGRERE